jgi:hypothetical protein
VTSALRQADATTPAVIITAPSDDTSGPFDAAITVDSIVFVNQHSYILSSAFMGSGQADTTGTGAPNTQSVNVHSFFDVFFDLSVPHSFDLTGTLSELVDGGISEATFQLTGPGTNLDLSPSSGNPLNLAQSGVLAAGSYHPVVSAHSEGTAGTNYFDRTHWDFNLALAPAPVPEPASLVLLGADLPGWP